MNLDLLAALAGNYKNHCDPIADLDTFLDARAAYENAITPSVVLRLLEVVRCAQSLDAGLLDMGDSYHAPAVLCEHLNAALEALSSTDESEREDRS